MNNPNEVQISGKNPIAFMQNFARLTFLFSALLLFTTTDSEAQSCGNDFDLNYSCGQQISVEAYGIGAEESAPVTLVTPGYIDLGTVDSIFVEVIMKGAVDSTQFEDIYVVTAEDDTCQVVRTVIESRGSAETAVAYRTTILPTASFTVSLIDQSDSLFLESVMGFAVISGQSCVGGATLLRGLLLFHACDTLTFIAPDSITVPRDVRLQIPLSEIGDVNNLGEARIDVNFYDGGVLLPQSFERTFTGNDNIGGFLVLFDTTIIGLPGGTDSMQLLFSSPGIPVLDTLACEVGFGDSFIVGSIVVETSCETGVCCDITCTPPDTVFELCAFAIPPVPADLMDSVNSVNGMGQNVDSLVYVDSIMGTITESLCDYFIIHDSTIVYSMSGVVFVDRYFALYTDSAGIFVYDTTCIQVFALTSLDTISLICPPMDSAQCNIGDVPPFTSWAAFLAAGGSATTDSLGVDTTTFALLSEVSDGMMCPETVTRTYFIEDVCGNVGSCTQLIIIHDTQAPLIFCQNLPTDAVCDASEIPIYNTWAEFISPTGGNGGAADNCGVDTSTLTLVSEVSDGMTCPETVTRTYSIADSCGNIASCTQIITVNDTIPPTLGCPPTAMAICDASEVPVYVSPFFSWQQAGGTVDDNCGIGDATFTLLSEVSDGNSCPEIVSRTYQIADMCGNTTTCVQLIIVNDTIVPMITCPTDLTAVCDISEVQAYATLDTFLSAGGTVGDNCGIDSLSFSLVSEVSDGMTCPETVTRTYSIADSCGNIASCTQLIVIDDMEAPMITCADDNFAFCDISEIPLFATYAEFVSNGGSATDNCGINESTFTFVSESSDGMMCPETVTRTYSIADSCGNTATCQQIITVHDTIPPMLICPLPSTEICIADVDAPVDNLIDFLALPGSQASDNCQLDTMSFTFLGEVTTGMCPDTITRTYSVMDACGNTTSCTYIIIVHDPTVPTISCPPGLTGLCDISEVAIYANLAEFLAAGGTVDDNCEIDSASFTLFQQAPSSPPVCPQTWSRIYQILDFCGNRATCNQTITIRDTIVPTITCPTFEIVECSASEVTVYDGTNLVAFFNAGGDFDDNCAVDSSSLMLINEVSDGLSCPETVTRTYSIADICGNVATCAQLIFIADTQPPMLTCPADTAAICDVSEVVPFTTYADFVTAGGNATDNCGIDETTFTMLSEVSDGMTCPETVTRTYQVMDSCSNPATCQQIILVNDTIPPMILCPTAAAMAQCDASEVPVFMSYNDFTSGGGSATDNCGVDTSTFMFVSEVSDGMTCPETVIRTYSIADSCGNTASCTQTIIVDDTIAPMITCPPTDTLICDISELPPFMSFSEFVAAGGNATDNCGIDESSFSFLGEVILPGNCPQIVQRIYVISDSCGNVSLACSHTLYVNDTIVPTITCPMDLTAVCDISEMPAYMTLDTFLSAGGIASDNCALDSASFMLVSEVSDGMTCPETVTRTYSIADSCGNIASCTQLITIHDMEAPMITCPSDTTVICDISELFIPATYADFTAAGGNATDNCGLDVTTFTLVSEVSDGMTCPETVTRTYSIADSCGNTATCQQLIMVNDTIPPMLLCPTAAAMAQCDASEVPVFMSYSEFTSGGGGAIDNCGVDTSTFMFVSEVSDGMTCPETVIRTYSIADSCGNTGSCTQTIIVDDTIAPMITCAGDTSAVCDASEVAAYTTYAEFTAAGGNATDNCGIDETTFTLVSEVSDGAMCPETVTRTYSIADSCGNTATCQQLIIVNDTIVPTITCPTALTAVCDISEMPAYMTLDTFLAAGGTASDNCALDSTSFMLVSEVSDGMTCPETVTRTYSIADSCGNIASCTQLITIHDMEAPMITCPSDTTVICDISELFIPATYADFTAAGGNATDNCGLDVTTFTLVSEVSDGMTCPETVTRTYSIADSCGNTATCQQLIMVNDTVPPMLLCPTAAAMAQCDASEVPVFMSYSEFTSGGGGAIDNCGVDTASFMFVSEVSDGMTCPETVIRTYSIADSCGNTASCTQTIIVDDTIAPMITCAGDTSAVCDASEVAPYATYADFTAAGGNATDNCGIDETTFTLVSEVSDGAMCPETVTRTYSIADSCGNIATCQQLVIVNDTIVPAITCPAALTAVCDISEMPAYMTLDTFLSSGGTVSDNCALDSASFMLVSEVSDGMTCPETVTRTYSIADSCGNIASCTQLITINDLEAPMITCPSDTTVICDISELPPYATYTLFLAAGGNATDNCGIDMTTFTLVSEVSDGMMCPETVTRTYSIADSCGNTATCQQLIMVNDTVPPMIFCPTAAATAQCDASEVPVFMSYNDFTSGGGSAMDNCGVDTSTFMFVSEVSDGMTCPETLIRTYSIADSCGNTASCTQTIIVDDTIAPMITCAGDTSAVCDASEVAPFTTYAEFTAGGGNATDNCGIDETTFTLVSEVSDGAMCPETVTRTYSIADSCGNTATCQQLIIVNDTIVPTITCPTGLTAVCDISEVPAYMTLDTFLMSGGTIGDNCALDSTSFMLVSEVSDGAICPEVVTRTYSIADSCGNTASCTQIITIMDTIPPTISCPEMLVIQCIGIPTPIPPAFGGLDEFLAAGGTVDDNCSIDTAAFAVIDESIDFGDCFAALIRTYSVMDDCGNMATCTQIIRIIDTIAPAFTCPPDLNTECSVDSLTPYASLVELLAAGGTVSDVCGLDSTTFMFVGDVTDGLSCPETITRTYSIADFCGNTTTCTQLLIVNDITPPVLTCPADTSAICDISEVPAYATYADFTAAGGVGSDNCGIDETTFTLVSEVSDGAMCPETVTRTYSIADSCGNVGTCQQLIIVNDTIVPTITCPTDLTAVCDISEMPVYMTLDTFLSAGGTVGDNCALDSTSFMLVSEVSDGMTCPETVTRTYSIADSCGNIASCTQLITINDLEAPMITCPSDTTVICDISELPAYTAYADFTAAGGNATDNCGIDETTFTLVSEMSDGMTCPETVTRTYSIADSCGNTATCQQLIMVNDTVPPMLFCPTAAATAQCDASEVPVFMSYNDFTAGGGSATDNCGVDTSSFMFVSEVSDGLTCPETLIRTYSIADSCGNTAMCTQTIIVDDTIAPMITCVGDTTAICDASEVAPYATYADFTAAGGNATDNCGIDETTFTLVSEVSDGAMCPETVTRTYSIADSCGNTATCQQLIIVNDTIVPTITCPMDLTAVCSISEMPAYMTLDTFLSAGGTVSDNCALDSASFMLVSEVSDGMTCPETVTRTYSIADSCGNIASCTQLITINDLEAPMITCPSDTTVICDISELPAYTAYADFTAAGGNATDNCGIDETTFTLVSEMSDGMTCPETVTRTYSIADSCGNTATCQQIITVNDTIPPTILCPTAPAMAQCDASEVPVFMSYNDFTSGGGSAMDNCGVDTSTFMFVSEVSDGMTCPETLIRTYSIADSCGNTAMCTQTIIVDDTIAPMITCASDTSAVCDASEVAPFTTYAEFTAGGGNATDNCGIDETTFTLVSEVSDGAMCPETVTRTYSIADSCGNTSTCQQLIIVNDTIVPTITCPTELTAVCNISEMPAYMTLDTFLSSGGTVGDNCALDSASFMLVSEVSDGMTCPETVTRTYSIADSCGNIASCTQLITINDLEAPMITCPSDTTVICDISELPAYTAYADFTAAGGNATDNCGIDETTFTLVSEMSDGMTCPETVTRIYSIADSCGNTATCQQLIMVNDTIAPTFTCPTAPAIAECDASEVPVITSLDTFLMMGGTAFDNCGLDSASFMLVSEVSDGMSCPETVTRTYSIADSCGNVTSCTQIILVLDLTPPMITCPADTSALCSASEIPVYASYTDFVAAGGNATDNCGIVETTFTLVSEVSDGAMCPMTVTRTYQIMDTCGNAATCQQIITVNDTIAPMITCPADLMAMCDISEVPAYMTLDTFLSAGGTIGDNCSIDSASFMLVSEVSDGMTCPETVVRTYSIADSCGNTASCTQVIVINDMVPPMITCAADTAALCDVSEIPPFASYADFVAAGGSATDSCGLDVMSFTMISETSDSMTCPETVTRTYSIADFCGNAATCQQIIIVNDTIPPTIDFGGNPGEGMAGAAFEMVECDASEVPIITSLDTFLLMGGMVDDNCAIDSMSFSFISEVSDSMTCPETVIRTYQIADLCGNTATATQTIVVLDLTAPMLTCPADSLVECSATEVPVYMSFADFMAAGGSASDNCELDSMSFSLLSEVSDGMTCPETVTRTYGIADLCGNVGTCQQIITVRDFTPPQILCPGDTTAVCDASEVVPFADLDAFIAAGGSVSDNCGVDTASFTLVAELVDTSTCPQIVVRTYSIVDMCGNGALCFQTITVNDTIPPSITCPVELEVQCDGTGTPIPPSFGGLDEFIAAGGIVDDNCTIDSASFSVISEILDFGDCFAAVVRTYQIADICGNTATCTQIVRIVDTIPPVLSCPADLMAECNADSFPAYTTIDEFIAAGGVISDACGLDSTKFMLLSEVSDSLVCPETITRTYYIEDFCGNPTTCTQLLIINDITPPTLTCPAADTTMCSIDDVPAYADFAAFMAAGGLADDNCGLDSASFTLVSEVADGTTCPITVTRTYSIADNCGNTASCTHLIIVSDTIAPTFTCPAPLTASCDISEVPAYANLDSFLLAGGAASDNCELDSLTFSLVSEVSDGATCPETVTRTYSIADVCGNVSTCTQTITIDDLEAPMLTCVADTSAVCDASEIPVITSLDEFMAQGGNATDNCGIDAATFTLVSEVSDGATCPETVTRTYSIADSCGNVATCAQIITVNDTIPPSMTCPIAADSTCTMMTTTYETLADFLAAGGTVDDNCGIDSASYTVVSQVITTDCPMTSTTTYSISDSCGNTTTCTTVMMITDDVAPMITCPTDLVFACDTDVPAALTTIEEFIAAGGFISDDCTLDSSSFMLVSDVNDGMTCPTTITRTYSVADLCGNTATCQQVITVNDTIAPTAVCMDITIMFDPDLTVIIQPEDVDGGSFDNCGDVTLSLTDSIFECADFTPGNMTMLTTLIVTDACGNTSTCEASVYGIGGSIEIECPQDQWINLDPGECSARFYYEVTAMTNCGPDPILVQVDTSGLTSGDYFPIGITVQEWIAHNGMGDTAFCSFTIEVHEYPEQVDPVCNGDLNISVDQNCEAFIGPDMILEGGPYGCYDDFLVEIEGVGSGMGGVLLTSEHVGGWFTVTITDPETGNSCWSTIHVEDKLPPLLTCISVELPCTADTEPVFEDPQIGTISLTENPGSSIGPGGGVVTTQDFVVSAPANAQVTDVNVRIDLDHTWSADLDVILIGPDGTEIILAQDVCGTANDWENVTFDDDAMTPVAAACTGGSPALVGPVQPEEPLAGFNGKLASGTWTLQITDDTGGDGGTLNVAGIDVAYFVALPYAPIVHEGCGPVELVYSDVTTGDDCSALIIERTWTATDPSGNSSTCVQTLTITPLDLDELEMPVAYIGECGESTDPSVTGWPTIGGIEISGGNVCNVFTTWEDKPLTDCGGGTKIIRRWLVLDWCNQEVVKGTQVIKLMDNVGPELTCPPDVTASSDTWTCYADVNLTPPTGVDACGSPFTMEPSASQGTIVNFGNYYRVDDLPLGETVITWTAEDACGNTSTCSYIITVVDDIPPVPLCDLHTIVSLTNDNIDEGLTKVSAEVFDDGSYDNCSAVTFDARRMTSCIDFDWTTNGAGIDEIPNGIVNSADKGTSFKPMVPFSCCDVAQGPIMVELRVTDASGNSNRCMVEIEVQDKLSPLITPPPSVEVSCDFWFAVEETNGFVPQENDPTTPIFGRVLDAYDYDQSDRKSIIIDDPGNDEIAQPHNWGIEGWADDNCDVDITVRVRVYDDCSGDNLPSGAPSPYAVRLVERTFLAKDAQGNSQTAVQRIWVIDYDPFYISDETCVNADPRDGVIWPCDEYYGNCPTGGIVPSYPTIFDDNCSLIGVTFEDERFDFVDGACYKILRHWTIIDWCQYDTQTGAGLWSYIQVIKVLDSDGPEVTLPDVGIEPFLTLCVTDTNVSLPANNQVFLGENNPLASSCSVHIVLEHEVTEMCSDAVTYDLKIYPNNGSDYMQVLNETEAAIDSNGKGTISFDSRTSAILGVRLNGLPYNDKYCTNGQKDVHRVLWSIEDGCGNTTTVEYLLRLEDCKAPSPVCLGLSSVVMPSSGEVTIWAADFNASSFDDCTAAADLLYSFSGTSYEPSRSFDCQAIEDNGSPSFLVEIYAVDEGNDQNCDGIITYDERNKDFCTTFIVIDDNTGICGDSSMAGGLIETEELESVENVTVTLMDELGLMTQTIVTDGSGTYTFINPLLSYTIEPKRDDNHMNGVSTLDLVRIQKHLLGIEPFESPYKMIAADANNSESVTALDLVEIRKLILGLNLEFPNNESWRFVDAGFVFTDNNNPWPFDEIIELEGGFNMEEDFMAVKIGDVNGTVTANATQIEVRESRNVLTLNTLDKAVSVGEEVTVEVTAEEFAEMIGYQFTLRTEGLKLTSVDAGILDMDAANVGVHKYHMTVSWHRMEAVTAQDGEVLFTLRFTATMEGQLSDMMSIGSEITEAEAYREMGSDAEIMDVELAFGDVPTVPTDVEFALYQNEPNPFNHRTKIGFTLPEAMDAKLTVFDMTGRIIKVIEGEYEAGYNEIQLLQQDLGTTGVLYYRLDAGDLSATGNANFSASKKLIIIE